MKHKRIFVVSLKTLTLICRALSCDSEGVGDHELNFCPEIIFERYITFTHFNSFFLLERSIPKLQKNDVEMGKDINYQHERWRSRL